jgi:Fe2+ or Zn2+ uptake regulation protein
MNTATFHNTVGLRGQPLIDAVRAAEGQEAIVLAVFEHAGRALTPSEVWRLISDAGHLWPLTSVRRAISNLTREGLLVKLDVQRTGIYGKPEHHWALPTGQGELFGRAA